MTDQPTVFVVDDDRGALESMRWLLESDGLVVETYPSGRAFLDGYDPARPGCVVLDLSMPGMDGLELQQRLTLRGGPLPIVFITGRGDVPSCAAAMKAGAVDFLEKPADDRRLLAVVRRAVEKDRQRRSIAASQPEIAARLARLTPRERQTMHLLYEGKAIKAIATELDIGFQTAAKHRARVLEKLELANETELARLLDRLGAEA